MQNLLCELNILIIANILQIFQKVHSERRCMGRIHRYAVFYC